MIFKITNGYIHYFMNISIGYLKSHCLNHIINLTQACTSLQLWSVAQVSDVTHRPPVVVLIKDPLDHSNADQFQPHKT